jgi:tyrosine aminotransferase
MSPILDNKQPAYNYLIASMLENTREKMLKQAQVEKDLKKSILNNHTDADWDIESSEYSKATCNPVRKMIEQMKIEPNPQLPMIALSIGDPTILSNLQKPDTVTNAIINCIKEKKYDGYTPSFGTEPARTAVAKYCSKPNVTYKASDIYLTNGCSQALDLCITVLANPGQNILIPKPGFSIYKTLCGSLGIEVRYYSLLVNI